MKANRQIRLAGKKLRGLCLKDGQIDATLTRELAQKIYASKRRGYIPLLWYFRRLVKLECSRHEAEIASAVPLGSDLRERIAAELKHTYGVGLTIRYVENPELIGGVRVQIGDDVFDDTVRFKLGLLEKSFNSASQW